MIGKTAGIIAAAALSANPIQASLQQALGAINIHVPSTPKHLRVTQTMIEDFLIDPVLGVWVFFGLKLDAFQQSRLRTYWWTPNVIDSSGVGTGKTIEVWLFLQLRCLLMADQKCLIMYQTFSAGKQLFWEKYYRDPKLRTKLFNAQLGKVDEQGESEGKANSRGASCYTQYFKNDSELQMPAPDWVGEAKGQKGNDLNVAVIDEWTKAEEMGRKEGGVGGINKQIISRVRRGCFNQHHPLWGNHRLFTASAESPAHPAWPRYRAFLRQVEKGNPNYATISYSYKDYSLRKSFTGKSFRDQLRDEETYRTMKVQQSRAELMRQAFGIWERETQGWYTEDDLERCVNYGKSMGLYPMIGRSEPLVA